MKESNLKGWRVLTFSALLLAGLSPMGESAAGHEIGNGGGAWVCQNNDQIGTIKWATLVDLYEGRVEFGLDIPDNSRLEYLEIVDQIMVRKVFPFNRDLYEQLSRELETVKTSLQFVEADLTVIDDALYRIQPRRQDCDGTISYVQLANYTDYGKILIQKNLFEDPHLKETDKAALLIHEAVYAYLRNVAEDKDSVRTRRIVGLLFSTLSQDRLKQELEKQLLLGGGLPVAAGQFVKIRAGSFLMGSPNDERDRDDDEKLHLVQITRDFEIQTAEVTQKQWFDVMGSNPSTFKKPESCPGTYQVIRGTALCPNHPVETVSWEDVDNFIRVLNATRRDGYLYRLPTEAEWEYAARAGTSTAYSFGNNANQLPLYAWYSGNSGSQTHEVAKLRANGWGLYDMHGNVWEWVSDWYGDYSNAGQVNPQGSPSGSNRVVRGGSGNDYAGYLRSADRSSSGPAYRYSYVGVRLVRTRL